MRGPDRVPSKWPFKSLPKRCLSLPVAGLAGPWRPFVGLELAVFCGLGWSDFVFSIIIEWCDIREGKDLAVP